ncbi:MAG TPA: POTRA domain-containing protein [Polyangiaceae bacterium]
MRPTRLWVRALVVFAVLSVFSGAARAADPPVAVPIPRPTLAPPAPQTPSIAPAPDLTGFIGLPIVRIGVLLEGNVWGDVEIPAIHDVTLGQPLTPGAARRALAEVLGTGRFARAYATAAFEPGGVALLLHAAPRKLVSHLVLETRGAPIDREELLREANLSEGNEIVAADIGDMTTRVARYLAIHGYPSAKVDIETRDTVDLFRALVVIDIDAGAPRIINDRHAYVFGPDAEALLPLADAYAVHPKERADEPALDAADAALERTLHGKGWYRAGVSHDLVAVAGPGGRSFVVLRIRIDAGPRQVPRFEGNDHYDPEVLTASLALDTETDRSPTHLAEKLVAFYRKRGFLDVEVRPEVRGGDQEPLQVVVFHVREHVRVQVKGRQYPCLKVDAIAHLSNGGPRSPGEIGTEIDSFLEEELPGTDLLVDPDPKGLSATIGSGAGQVATGARPSPIDLKPDATYVVDTYERAVAHVRELYRNEGFLHAEVGPVGVLRARCDPRSPPGRCKALRVPALPENVCAYGPSGLPTPATALDPSYTCRPDSGRGIACADSVELVLPIKLGPRTDLWDVSFSGVRSASEAEVAAAAQLALGDPISNTRLDAARRRIVDWYKERGYAYADVKYALEPSIDNTRARLRFDVTEGEQVVVRDIVIRGLKDTRESVVRRRIKLEVGGPYRTSDADATRERIDTLGVFSSVTLSLSDPYVPQAHKTVYIDVVERLPRYLEVRPGFSTGEGVRGTIEYDERNVLGYAIGAVLRAQLSYLPDFLILDPQVATNYQPVKDRLARRITASASFPEVGLGPQVRAQADAIYVRDLERDFALDKVSGFGSLIYRPVREVTVTLGQSVEDNDVRLFQFNSLAAYLACATEMNTFSPGLAALLRVPDGESLVIAQRAAFTWDRRDSAFNAHRGTFVYLGAELVNSVPEGSAIKPNPGNLATTCSIPDQNQLALQPAPQAYAHFVRLTQTFGGYIPLFRDVSLALELRLGENVRVAPCGYVNPAGQSNAQDPVLCTYPDRLFFMGGFDSMRGWLQDTFMPQDYADQIAVKHDLCLSSSSNCLIPLRGGNLMINPRVELRFPIYGSLDGALFADFGNLWVDPTYIETRPITLRADVGPGVRLQTPVGPLVFDYGINVTRRFYEDFGAFHFAIGLF